MADSSSGPLGKLESLEPLGDSLNKERKKKKDRKNKRKKDKGATKKDKGAEAASSITVGTRVGAQ